MLSSSDIANLMEQAQKLKATFDRFAVSLADEGMIDRNKLPWMSSIADDSAGVIVSDLPTSKLCQNEVTESPIEYMMQNNDTTPGAHNLFDKMSEPVLNSNQQGKNTLVYEHDEIQGSVDYNTIMYEFPGLQASVDESFEDKMECISTSDTQVSNAHQMFDEMTLPDFTQATKTEEDNPVEHDHEPTTDIVYDDQDDAPLYERHMFAKLGALDGSFINDLVIIGAHIGRFSKLRGILFGGCQLYDQKSHDEGELTEGMSCRCPNSQVRIVSFSVLKEIHPINFVKNVVWPFLVSATSWFVNSSLCMALGVDASSTRDFEFENGLGMFFYFEGFNSLFIHHFCPLLKMNIKCDWELHCSRSKCICTWKYTTSFLTHTFDPGGVSLEELPQGYDKPLFSSFKASDTACRKEMATQVKLFDPRLILGDMPYDPGVTALTRSDPSSLAFTCTLEDKGVFKGKEDEVHVTCAWELCNTSSLWPGFIYSWTKKRVSLLNHVLEPGGLYQRCTLLKESLFGYNESIILIRVNLLSSNLWTVKVDTNKWFMVQIYSGKIWNQRFGGHKYYGGIHYMRSRIGWRVTNAKSNDPYCSFHIDKLKIQNFFGGYGVIYGGVLIHLGRMALKRVRVHMRELCTELVVVGSIHHVNLVKVKTLSLNQHSLSRTLFDCSLEKPQCIWNYRSDTIDFIQVYAYKGKEMVYSHNECKFKYENVILMVRGAGIQLLILYPHGILLNFHWLVNCASVTSLWLHKDDTLTGEWHTWIVSYKATKVRLPLKWESGLIVIYDIQNLDVTNFIFDPGGQGIFTYRHTKDAQVLSSLVSRLSGF